MKLVVGIGNPGPVYEHTRHNVGFDTVDRLAARHGSPFTREGFWNSLRARVTIRGSETTLLKPLSFVNLTGPVVRKVAFDLEAGAGDLLLVQDDFWLPLGSLRLKARGSAGGHRGLASTIRALGTEEVPRLRIGIGEPGREEAADYVLSRFSPDERKQVEEVLDTAADAVEVWVGEGIEAAMNRFNRRPPEET